MIRKLIPLAVLLLLLLAPGVFAGELAFVGGTVHPVSGPAIENGTVLVEDGVIRAVGTNLDIPEGAERVDLSGKHLYPGFVHPLTPIGLSEIGSVRGTVDVREIGDNNSDLRAEVAFNADSLRLPAATAGGVTSALVYQRGGLFTGTSAVMRLHGWNWRDMAIAAPAGLHLDFPDAVEPGDDESEDVPETDKEIAALNDWLARAKAYDKASSAGSAGLEANPKLERLAALLRGELKLFVHADGVPQLTVALDWLDEQAFSDVVLISDFRVQHLGERIAEAGYGVILNGVHDLPDKAHIAYDAPFVAAASLQKQGVRFCIGDGGVEFISSNARNLPFHAATAVAFGLDRDKALRSVTLDAAEILGVGDRVGSIEPGKEASLMITDGDPLEILTRIEKVWIAGHAIDPNDDHQYRLYRKYDDRPRPGD